MGFSEIEIERCFTHRKCYKVGYKSFLLGLNSLLARARGHLGGEGSMVTPHVLFTGHAGLWVSRMAWACGLTGTSGARPSADQRLRGLWGGVRAGIRSSLGQGRMALCWRAGKCPCGSARFGAPRVSGWWCDLGEAAPSLLGQVLC